MNFSEYQKLVQDTAIYPDKGNNYVYPALGLAGESGEVCEKIKKLIRDKNGEIDEDFLKAVTKELGDVMWYLSALASEFKLSFEAIAIENIKKLYGRRERGTLSGSGDDR